MPAIARKQRIRAWLYELLAKLETANDVDASKLESGNTTKIIISWLPDDGGEADKCQK